MAKNTVETLLLPTNSEALTVGFSSEFWGVYMEDVMQELENIRHKKVIVEGRNDKRFLERLGFKKIVTINQPLYKMVEDSENEEEVVILTDLDSAGKQLYGRLHKDFTRRGVKVDSKIRNLLFRTQVRQIEGLANYLERRGF